MLLIGLLLLLLATAISSSNNINEKRIINYAGINTLTNSKESIINEEIKPSSFLIVRITFLLLLFSAYLSYNINYMYNIGNGIGVYGGLFQISYLSQNFDIFLYLMGGLLLFALSLNNFTLDNKSTIKRINSYKEEETTMITSEYAIIALFSIIGGSLLISSKDLISMYISIELQSFALYILATVYRNYDKGARAGLKYFLLGGLSSCFILLGIGIIYATLGLTDIDFIFMLLKEGNFIKSIEIGLIIILVGFLFKISAAPFHNWAPDVYDGVPTLVTLWLSVITKISICIIMLNLIYHAVLCNLFGDNDLFNINSIKDTNLSLSLWLLLISSFLSLLIGTIVGLVQFRIKRLLVYSTISHVGFILAALIVNNKESFESLLFYLVGYTIINANNFLIIIAFGYLIIKTNNNIKDKYSPIQYIDDLKGSFYINKTLSLCFAISLFSLAGIPPLIGFFTKQAVLMSAISGGYIALSIVAILVSVISAAYYLKIISLMFFNKYTYSNNLISNDKSSNVLNNNVNVDLSSNKIINYNYLSNTLSFCISSITMFTILFFIKPYLILNWTHLLALSLFFE
jgi:NADH-ubiquinone oxidoreductase chain 2